MPLNILYVTDFESLTPAPHLPPSPAIMRIVPHLTVVSPSENALANAVETFHLQ